MQQPQYYNKLLQLTIMNTSSIGFISSFMKAQKEDPLDLLTKDHQNKAVEFYSAFQDNFLKNVEADLNEIKKALNIELSRTTKKLEHKLKGEYAKSLSSTLVQFHLESFASNEIKQVYESISKLKERIYKYINEFCDNILSRNIEKNHSLSLYHFSNQIRSLDKNWSSVSSRSFVPRAEITVKGFYRPQTTWLALGVTRKLKQLGAIPGAFNKEDFMGNIYLNGSDEMAGGYKLRKDLAPNDVFVIESENRMVWVYRKSEGKNKKEVFIMNDNVEYFIYIGIKGPIELKFEGFG